MCVVEYQIKGIMQNTRMVFCMIRRSVPTTFKGQSVDRNVFHRPL